LEECQQNYTYMRKQYKADALYEKMLHHGSEFGLVNLTYPSFRSVGSYGNTQLPAADLVSAAAAILEAHESTRSATDGSSEGGPSGNAFAAASSAITVGMRDGLDCALRNGVMRNGLERAKELLRATVAVANSVLTARQWANCGDFHSVVLKSGGDTGHFLNPLALTKLALFIADALRELSHRAARSKPLLLAVPNLEDATPTYMVVAVLGSARCWRAGGKNSFGNAFTIAAEKTNAHVSHEGFDSTVCKVVAADYERFHENIVLELRQAE